MQSFPYPKTTIIRHQRENLKKCSLRGLEPRNDMQFFSYPQGLLPDLNGYMMLVVEGAPPLTSHDHDKGLLILDSTWRYLQKMISFVEGQAVLEKRTLPGIYRTAYPRKQDDCPDPTRGLSSLEALFIAYHILGRATDGLLDNYYWKEPFLKTNFK